MNYRHAYHAANFADVIKHIVLLLCLDYLQRKPGPLCVIDAHARPGLYDLHSEEAAKTGEWQRGIGRLQGFREDDPDLGFYLARVRSFLADGHYPGSPLLIARSLRPQDRMIAAELHSPSFEALRDVLLPYAGVRVAAMDAYQCVRANIPPRERRGLVLIDPPYEKKDEFATLHRQIGEWKKRWAAGVYLLWYPIKTHLPYKDLRVAARNAGFPKTWVVETLIRPREAADTLNGCGVIVFNPPYTVPERVEALLPALSAAVQLHETQTTWECRDAAT